MFVCLASFITLTSMIKTPNAAILILQFALILNLISQCVRKNRLASLLVMSQFLRFYNQK